MVKKNGLPADDCGIAIITAAVLRRGQMLHHIALIFSALVLAQLSLQHAYQDAPIGTCLWMQAFVLLVGLTELWFAAQVDIASQYTDGFMRKVATVLQGDAAPGAQCRRWG